MNDSEIVKGLECCETSNGCCYGCPLEDIAATQHIQVCQDKLITEAYKLIDRQNAEIDRLNIDLKAMRGAANSYKAHYEDLKSENLETIKILKTAKSEAVREFAENLKRKSELVAPSVWAIPYRAVAVADIDKLLEGMGCNDGK